MPDQALADDLEQLRLRAGLSLRELVKRCGVPRSTLSDALAGRRVPRLDTVVAVVRACGEDPEPWRHRWSRSAARQATAPQSVAPARAADAAPIAPSGPAELPRDVDLAGRGVELRQLDGHGVWVVHGSPGVGKTALAVHWAHRISADHPDGQLFVNLRGHHPSLPPMSAAEILARLLRSIGVEPERITGDVEDLARLWRTTLSGRRVLIVLDDALDTEQVRPALPGESGCTLVVTSRHHLIELMVRDGAAGVRLDVLDEDDARAVLEQSVGADRLRREPEASARVVRACAHLPLALRLAGAVLALDRDRTLADLADALVGGGRLTTLEQPLTPSPVEAAFELSYRALDPDAQLGFRLLGLHPGPDLGVDPTVLLIDGDRQSATRVVGVLAEAHLIEPSGGGHYRMHDLVREYAVRQSERLDTAAQREVAVTRLLDWYADRAAAVTTVLCPGAPRFCTDSTFGSSWAPDAAGAAGWLDAQQRNVLAAIEHDARHGSGLHAWRLVDLLGVVLLRRSDVTDLLTATDAGLIAARAHGDRRAEATMLLNRAWLYWRSGQIVASNDDFRHALASFRATGQRRGEAAALLGLATQLAVGGQLVDARTQASQAFELYRDLDDRHGLATTHNALAKIAQRMGDISTAATHFGQSAALLREGGNRGNLAIALGNLTLVCVQIGELGNAVDHAIEGLQVADDVGDRYARADVLVNGSIALEQLGRLAESHDWATQGLAVAREIGDRSFEICALDALGTVTRRLGEPGVDDLRTQALQLCRSIEDRAAEAEILLARARDAYWAALDDGDGGSDGAGGSDSGSDSDSSGRLLECIEQARRGIEVAVAVGQRHCEAETLVVLAAAELALGHLGAATDASRRAVALHLASGARLGEARARQVLGRALRAAGDATADAEITRSRLLFDAAGVPGAAADAADATDTADDGHRVIDPGHTLV